MFFVMRFKILESMRNLSDVLILLPNSQLLTNRSANQIFVMVLMESPVNTPGLERWNGKLPNS